MPSTYLDKEKMRLSPPNALVYKKGKKTKKKQKKKLQKWSTIKDNARAVKEHPSSRPY